MKRGVFIFWSVFVAAALTRLVFSLAGNGATAIPCVKQVVSGNGVIAQEPERKEGGQVFVVHASELISGSSSGSSASLCAKDLNIRMKTKLYPRFVYGDAVSFEGKISQPFNFKSDSGRSFDYQGYLAKDDIFYEIKSAQVKVASRQSAMHESADSSVVGEKSAETLEMSQTDIGLGGKISAALFSIKRRFVANLEHTLGEPHAALAAGLVVGEKSALGKDLLEDFRIVGLIHIIVLSGFNITVVGDAMRRILSFLPRVWGISIGGAGIMLFGVMVGGGATVVRSCFMAGVALSADLIRRDYDVTRALVFAGLVMVIQNPTIVFYDPSFQLSFLATLGLILLASPIEKKLSFVPEKFGMRGIVASTIATQIFVSPFILYMMGQISLIGMVVNILVLPIIPATMLFVFLTGATGFIWMPIAQVFGWVSHILLTYELSMVEWFARVPYASLSVPMFSKWWVVAFYVGFAVVYVGRRFFEKKTTQPSGIESIFDELQNIPKGTWISKAGELVSTPFKISKIICVLINIEEPKTFFTRRSLKHLAEKGIEGKRLLKFIPTIFSDPEIIYEAKESSRWLILKPLPYRGKILLHGVVVEKIQSKDILIITSFIVKQKYLKNFKILWRTAAS